MNQKSRQEKKVFVALSGGVDSSVAAALLKEEGYMVVGVFMKVWQPDFLECTWRNDRLDAMRVCAQLEIPFKTYDFEDEYKRDVVDYMIAEYSLGRTPNPDVVCNTRIKFDAFLRAARKDGADYIATGHYVQRVQQDHAYTLHTAKDRDKDQSYFLWGLSSDVLKQTLFPIGVYQKSEVRKLAKKFGLPTAEKRESQGLCFLGKLDMHDFLRHFLDECPGSVLNTEGQVVGNHAGALFYTLGQRHGFQLDQSSESVYVVAKDMVQNTLTVSTDPKYASRTNSGEYTTLSTVNWISGSPSKEKRLFLCRSRYRQPLIPCHLVRAVDRTAAVAFPGEKPILPPGQSLVLYEETKDSRFQLIGGGIIEPLV